MLQLARTSKMNLKLIEIFNRKRSVMFERQLTVSKWRYRETISCLSNDICRLMFSFIKDRNIIAFDRIKYTGISEFQVKE